MRQTHTCVNCGHIVVLGEGTGVGEDDPIPGDFYAETCFKCRPDLELLEAVQAVDWDAILGDIFSAGQEYNVTDEDHKTTARHEEWISNIQDALRRIGADHASE